MISIFNVTHIKILSARCLFLFFSCSRAFQWVGESRNGAVASGGMHCVPKSHKHSTIKKAIYNNLKKKKESYRVSRNKGIDAYTLEKGLPDAL